MSTQCKSRLVDEYYLTTMGIRDSRNEIIPALQITPKNKYILLTVLNAIDLIKDLQDFVNNQLQERD
jgi:hypothetical protein